MTITGSVCVTITGTVYDRNEHIWCTALVRCICTCFYVLVICNVVADQRQAAMSARQGEGGPALSITSVKREAALRDPSVRQR